jgi:hypothetical protein
MEISPFLDPQDHNNNNMDPSEKVISALKDRNIYPKREEIAAAFHDTASNVENTEWVQEHLTPDALLSQEELKLYVVFTWHTYAIPNDIQIANNDDFL